MYNNTLLLLEGFIHPRKQQPFSCWHSSGVSRWPGHSEQTATMPVEYSVGAQGSGSTVPPGQ
jgi:hypothetical protein